MKYTILALLCGVCVAAPQGGYQAPNRGGGGGFISGGSSGFSSGGGFVSGGGSFSGGGSSFGGGQSISFGGCPEGQARKADGSCAKATITRNLFLYAAPPAQRVQVNQAQNLPDPKVHYNFVFVRTPEITGASRPVVVPPPQQKTLVYVLSKRPGALDQEVIEVPVQPTQPEVYFVNYEQGDNPELPGGIDLQQALSQSAQQGRIIDGGAGSGSDFGGSGIISGGDFGGSSSGGFVGQDLNSFGGGGNIISSGGQTGGSYN